MNLPRFLSTGFSGYEILDVKEWLSQGRIEIILNARDSRTMKCHRCGEELGVARGKYQQHLKGMPVMGYKLEIKFWRYTGHCSKCKKARAEAVSFVSKDTPHMTEDYAWWLGRLCEIAAISRVAELCELDETTLWRIDFERMKHMLTRYKIPPLKRLSVDEVYARKKPLYKDEPRINRFFTVVSDLETRKVIWVSEGRSKEALDQFFILIGKEACDKIEVAAMDQFDGYFNSVKEHCKNAVIVWDRFHLMKLFEEAVNETRKDLHNEAIKGSPQQLWTSGKYRYIFLKKEYRRTLEEKLHIEQVTQANAKFSKLEIIKERMLSFFDQPTEDAAKAVFEEIGDWIWQSEFTPLQKWYKNFEKGWDTVKNYFTFKTSSSLSEGINNVIKSIKRRAFGYKNMEYFRLKIMQVCGYLNSRFIPARIQ
jgi:transposase